MYLLFWDTVKGVVTFDFPATIGGKVIHNLKLTFKDGVVSEVQADDNVEFVKILLHLMKVLTELESLHLERIHM